jgi:hypothetical protein
LKTEIQSEVKINLEINKDTLNSFKRTHDVDVKKSMNPEALNANLDNISNINNNSFVKEQNNSFFTSNKNDKKDNGDPFLSNLKLDRSRDKENKPETNKFISLKTYQNDKDKITGKINNFKSKLTEKISSEPEKPPTLNTKLASLAEKIQNTESTINNLTEKNDFKSLNSMSKELDQSPRQFSNRKIEEMRKNILTCFGEKKETEK